MLVLTGTKSAEATAYGCLRLRLTAVYFTGNCQGSNVHMTSSWLLVGLTRCLDMALRRVVPGPDSHRRISAGSLLQ